MMKDRQSKMLHLGLTTLGGFLLLLVALFIIRSNASVVQAGAIDLQPRLGSSVEPITPPLPATGEITVSHVISPPEGFPKFSQSVKTVTPTLASTTGVTLYYTIEIANTGAWTATNATLTDAIPNGTSYNGDAHASDGAPITDTNGTLSWAGVVGFDASVVISFSVGVPAGFTGTVRNTAVISDPLATEPFSVAAETIVTDKPILSIEKTSAPIKPRANKPVVYSLIVVNQGQPSIGLPLTVTDRVPLSTTLRDIGPDGFTSPISDVVTWTRNINLDTDQTTEFTFSVTVDDVPARTVITNADYQVASAETGVTSGDAYTVTVVDPEFRLFKEIWPDPPGSNRAMTYTLALFNQGSLATNLVITDRVPAGVIYQSGGSLQPGGVVSWTLPSLDTGETAQFTFTVDITDVAEVAIVNNDYAVCSAEGICQVGTPLTSIVKGPTFEVIAIVDPIAKKPGGGSDPSVLVTPTLVIRNLGPGSALDARVTLEFNRISVSANDLYAIPAIGTPPPFPDVNCGPKCIIYNWEGDLYHGDVITFTTTQGQSSIGSEGSVYTATAVVTDSLANITIPPVTGTATGRVTQKADLLPLKSALSVIAPGRLLTYTVEVVNTGLSTDQPPYPWLTDTVPLSTTFVSASHGGMTQTVTNTVIVSWTLPALSTGSALTRSFTVRVDDNVVSGTQIVNDAYVAYWYEEEVGAVFSNTGQPVTTTVQEVGLIDSYKVVTPSTVLQGGVLTYFVHIVNSSGIPLTDVTVEDLLPWQISTYQRDPIASGGNINEHDIVSIHWTGDVDAFSSEIITFSAVVDSEYQGPITNTAIISHPDLLREIERQAVAYVTEKPMLLITKSAPYSVEIGAEVPYVITVQVLGWAATNLVISDTIPANTHFAGFDTPGGQLVGDQVQWEISELGAGESRTFEFRVTVSDGTKVTNDQYGVTSAEGVVAIGEPVITYIGGGLAGDTYLPIILRNY